MAYIRASNSTVAAAITIVMSLFATQAQAQISGFERSSAPIIGGTEWMPPPPSNPFATKKGLFTSMHETVDGKPCVGVLGSSVPQVVNPHIFNHVVLMHNACGQTIKVKVCYYQSSSCIIAVVNGYQKLERTLGISPGLSDFRYEYRELF